VAVGTVPAVRITWLAAGVGALVLIAGCGATPGTGQVTRTADAWLAAARAGDGASLCRLLTPAAAQSAETGGQTCAQAVGSLDLPAAGPVGAVQVWSDRAQVRTPTDTVFLTRLTAGWRVSAAGCTAERDRPYDCEVGG
jgi:hypothetical protein